MGYSYGFIGAQLWNAVPLQLVVFSGSLCKAAQVEEKKIACASAYPQTKLLYHMDS